MHSDSQRLRKRSAQRVGGLLFVCVLLLMGCSELLGLQRGTPQAACTTDAQCAPGYGCLENLGCRNRCNADSDCGAGSRCFKAFVTTACIPVTDGCGSPDPDSGASDSCPQGTSCDGSVCRTTCTSAAQCAGGQKCTNSACVGTDPSHESSNGGSGGGASAVGGGGKGGTSAMGGSDSGGAPDSSEGGGTTSTSAGASAGGVSGSSGGTSAGGSGGCTTKNACGGCSTLTGSVGDICAGCGKLTCNGFNALSCESSCAPPKAACNTTTNQCVACLGDLDCPSATPVCSASNTCLVCKPSTNGCSSTTPTSCNATGTVLTSGAVHSGTCGATCDPGNIRCTNLIGQKCSVDGTAYISSGSNTQCGCTDSGGRFTFVADGKVKDASTGLVWDFPEHAPDSNANASATCAAKGMRLPNTSELQGLLLAAGPAMACTQKLELAIDSVAFPGIVATTRYWTGTPESGFPGYYFVVYFFGPTTQTSGSGSGTTDRTSAELVAYQCVQ